MTGVPKENRRLLLIVFGLIPPTASSFYVEADEAARAEIVRLEARLEAQQRRLGSLREQVEGVGGSRPNLVRDQRIRDAVREVLTDGEFRQGLYPEVRQVGYDRGFYIKSADEAFLMRVSGWTWIRWTGQNRQTEDPRRQGRQPQDDLNGFEIKDLRLIFSGHIHGPELTYRIQAKGDPAGGASWRTWDATITYAVADAFAVTAGVQKVPFGRQRLYGKPVLQFMDRSVAETSFTLSRSIGLVFHGSVDKRLSYAVGVMNGLTNRNDSPSLDELDTNFAYAARAVAHILGEPIKTESDLAFSRDPHFEVGLSAAHNDDNGDRGTTAFYSIPDSMRLGRGIGGHGTADLTGTDLLQVGADAAFQYRGLSLSAEYWLRSVDSESAYSVWQRLTGRSDARHQQAGYVQAGYFVIPKRLELAARLGGVWDNDDDTTWEMTFGVSYFPWGTYNVVLRTDFTRIAEAPRTSGSPGWSQNDEISMVRVQMMVRF